MQSDPRPRSHFINIDGPISPDTTLITHKKQPPASDDGGGGGGDSSFPLTAVLKESVTSLFFLVASGYVQALGGVLLLDRCCFSEMQLRCLAFLLHVARCAWKLGCVACFMAILITVNLGLKLQLNAFLKSVGRGCGGDSRSRAVCGTDRCYLHVAELAASVGAKALAALWVLMAVILWTFFAVSWLL